MNFKDLQYFSTLAKTKNFGEAAALCGVSQPGLSIQIKKLEKELGVNLFERSTKQVVITPEGSEILERAERILREANDLRLCAKQFRDPYQGKLIIGAFPTLAPYLFPRIISDLRSSYPKMKFYIGEDKTVTLLEQLKSGKIDAAFIALPHEDKQLESQFIFEEEFLLAVSKTNPRAKCDSIDSKEIKGEELMLLSDGHCLRDQSLEFCGANQISESVDFRASGLETLRQMVAGDLGMTLIPTCAKQNNDGLAYIPFTDPAPKRRIALFWRKSSAKRDIFLEIADDLASRATKDDE
jgi:LysR family transcriptional regulator, hydrogen peroxide-inducible genes activator